MNNFVNLIVLFIGALYVPGCMGSAYILVVDQMCTHAFVPKGKICRPVKDCSLPQPRGHGCRPRRTFLDCVPKGSDDVCKGCNLRAVLEGSVKNPQELKPVTCSNWKPCQNNGKCYKGHCCYNDYKPTVKHPACPWCDLPCPPEYSCQKVKASCGHAYACLPKVKPGFCPMVFNTNEACPKIRPPHLCKEDGDCSDNLKCCTTDHCGGCMCKKPGGFYSIFSMFRK